MNERIYFTHAEWRVQPGCEEAFVAAWRALADAFAALPARPLWGTLLQSQDDPSRFFSFGPWASDADIAAMRADPAARHALERVAALCVHAAPGTCRLVAHVELRPSAT